MTVTLVFVFFLEEKVRNGYRQMKRESATSVKIQDKAVSVSLCANAFEKNMHSSLLYPQLKL